MTRHSEQRGTLYLWPEKTMRNRAEPEVRSYTSTPCAANSAVALLDPILPGEDKSFNPVLRSRMKCFDSGGNNNDTLFKSASSLNTILNCLVN